GDPRAALCQITERRTIEKRSVFPARPRLVSGAVRPSILACAGLLALGCASARADVFVRADPTTARAQCVAGAGDGVAAGGAGGRRDGRVGVGGRVLPGLRGCPAVTAAADGTAAVAASPLPGLAGPRRFAVRRPGAPRFGPVVTLPRASDDMDVAAAPGGWVAVTWTDSAIRARVLSPDGRSRTAALARDASFGSPPIGIDAHAPPP